ncbi:MAG: patatin-like phospholipase family protein [Lutisporaceae bacterium]
MTQYGIVLGGGGAKGSYEIGVWKALLELNIPIRAVVGTSVGAINAAIMVQGDFDIAYKLWNNLDMESVINLGDNTLLDGKQLNLKDLILTARKIIENRGLDITPLRNMLHQYIDESVIRLSSIDFGLVTFSLSDFKSVAVFKDEIPDGLLIDYLLASSCLPGFRTHEIKSKKFMDGGIYDNIPISLMIKKDIRDIIVVDVSGIGRIKKVNLKGFNVKYIKNSDPLCGTLQFDGDKCKEGITMGYLDALKSFGAYEGKRYYIEINSEEKNKQAYPLRLEELNILDSMLDLKANSATANKLINYPLLRTIYKYLSSKLNSMTIIQAAAEITAEVFNIQRLKAYTWDELIEETMKVYDTIKSESTKTKNPKMLANLLHSKKVEDIELLDLKALAVFNTDFLDQDINSKLYRKLMAIFLPKVCIANIFLSLMVWRRSNQANNTTFIE